MISIFVLLTEIVRPFVYFSYHKIILFKALSKPCHVLIYRCITTIIDNETIRMHAIYSDACMNVHADTTSLLLSKPKKREFFRQTLEKRKYVCFSLF